MSSGPKSGTTSCRDFALCMSREADAAGGISFCIAPPPIWKSRYCGSCTIAWSRVAICRRPGTVYSCEGVGRRPDRQRSVPDVGWVTTGSKVVRLVVSAPRQPCYRASVRCCVYHVCISTNSVMSNIITPCESGASVVQLSFRLRHLWRSEMYAGKDRRSLIISCKYQQKQQRSSGEIFPRPLRRRAASSGKAPFGEFLGFSNGERRLPPREAGGEHLRLSHSSVAVKTDSCAG